MRTKTLFVGLLLVGLLAGCGERSPVGPDGSTTTAPVLAPVVGDGVDIALTAGGAGLFSQPASFGLDVPVGDTSEILQAYFYWSGRSFASTGDPTIVINGTEYVGTVQDTYPVNSGLRYTFFYRLDALAAGLVQPGMNSYEVGGFDLGEGGLTDGIGLAVIHEAPGSGYREIQILEPNEFLYYADPDFPQGEVHGFLFPPSDSAREGRLLVFIGDCKADRPDKLWYTTGTGMVPVDLIDGPYPFVENEFVAANGAEFDVYELPPVSVPAGDDYFAYQLHSPPDGNGDSFQHTFAAFCIPGDTPPPPGLGCRVTGGGVDEFGDWDGSYANGNHRGQGQIDRYTFGGQAGAPTGSQPQPWGEWTHHQQRGEHDRFVFHAGTASAPPGTEIDLIECSDPGWCVQARPAPAKQIDFEGVGTFRTINSNHPDLANVVAGETFHWFEVHIEDLGEPGNGGHQEMPDADCPEEGSAGGVADCECPDFYSITIYEGVPAGGEPNRTDVIYNVYGYVRGGNLQIHPPLD
jgi:hypothetical protein